MALKKTKAPDAAPAAVTTYDWGAVQTTGFENVSKEDLGIPFLVVLQKGSPEVDRTHPDYATKAIKGAEAGDIVNTISRQILYKVGSENPLRFIACGFEKLFVEWKDRESGGGMVRAHRDPNIVNECNRNERGQDILRNGNIIVTTAYFYGLVITDTDRIPAIIGMSSTQLKKSRLWLNMMSAIKVQTSKGLITPPMFSHIYSLTTVPEANEKGSWFGWKISCLGQVNDPVMIAEAIETSKRATSGQRTALPPPPQENESVPFA
jgi:hypothetical protein